MAYLKSTKKKIKSRAAVLKVIEYVTDEKKAAFVSCENCYGNSGDIFMQFDITRDLHNKNNGILTHHYVQSFSPDDNITADEAHEIAAELMKRIAPNYQYIISTHKDKDHIHNHIVINSVNPLTGYKWHDNEATVNHLRAASDEICVKHGFSIITESDAKGIDQATQQLAVKGTSWKMDLLRDLDEAVLTCGSKIEFIDFLNKRDYSVRYKDAHITITKNGEKKGIRVDTLARQFGEKYKKENLEKAMGYHSARKLAISPEKEKVEYIKNETSKALSEWRRYENWYFKEESKKPKRFKGLTSLPASVTASSRLEIFLLRLMFHIILKAKIKNKYSFRAKGKKYKLQRLDKNQKGENFKKFSGCAKAAGNISREELLSADGKNIYADIDTLQLLKLSEADFFYSAKIDVKRKTAQVLIKEENVDRLSALIGVSAEKIGVSNRAIARQIVYKELKKAAEQSGEKLEYRVTDTVGEASLLKKRIKFAAFPKEDGKINIAFLPRDREIVNQVLSSAGRENHSESERGRSLRLNNEIKKAAALAGEKPVYRVVRAPELAKLRETEVKFAAFPNGDRYNIVFLREHEGDVKRILADTNIREK